MNGKTAGAYEVAYAAHELLVAVNTLHGNWHTDYYPLA